MAVFRVPGPIGRNQVPPSIDDGTICRAASPLPGPSTSKRKSQQSPADLHWSANRQTPKTNALTPERKRIKFKKPTPLETLRLGAQGEIVRKLQRLLNTRVSPNLGLAVDGMFGPKTREAVLAFQNAQHLAPDAIVGPQTWYFLLKNEPVKPQFSPLNSVQTPPKPAPGQMAPTVTAPVTKRAVWEWSLKEKLLAVVERVPKRLGPQLRKEWEALIQPESLVISLLIIAGFCFLSGGTALILGLVLLGADAGMALASAIMTASQAANEEELDEAAGELSHVVITLGVAAFLHGVGKTVGKLRRGSKATTAEAAPAKTEMPPKTLKQEPIIEPHKSTAKRATEAGTLKTEVMPPGAVEGRVRGSELLEGKSHAGFPDLPQELAMNFVKAEAVELPPGTKLYRVFGEPAGPNGGYWSLEKPTSMADWRGKMAVNEKWNSGSQVVEMEVGPKGMKVWKGPAAAQPVSTNPNAHFPGGGEQVWIPPKNNPGIVTNVSNTGW